MALIAGDQGFIPADARGGRKWYGFAMKSSPTKYQVAPTAKGGWMVRQGDGAAKVFSTQREAVAAAQAAVRKAGGQLIIHAPNGRVKKSFTLGRTAMEKLNAVEGVVLSAKSRQTLVQLDRQGASSEARRAAIAAPYRRAKP